ncbi:MAG: hypothetical protein HXS50_03680 [Theionarchaea archaeon]|nr:hypothetical protein [Theionarchaea archaeon]
MKIKLRGTYIEGVPAIDLIEDLDFPIESPSELLARLAKPRTKPGIASDAPITLEDNRGENPPDEAISQDNPGEEESSLNHHVQILEETSS